MIERYALSSGFFYGFSGCTVIVLVIRKKSIFMLEGDGILKRQILLFFVGLCVVTLTSFVSDEILISSAQEGTDNLLGPSKDHRAMDLTTLAFPSAEGFGAWSIGGRGGRVIEVTNLNDSGPGSLRAAIEAEGPRVVVFRVGGTIELEEYLDLNDPYITIAGQTAPGEGISLTKRLRIKDTHDVIIRHIRVRYDALTDNRDGISIINSHNVILDHCSTSWGTDEIISATEHSYDVTIQWCIMAESIPKESGKGSLISSGARNISIHHNVYAHNFQRNAKLKGDKDVLNGKDAIFDFVNNIIYNWEGYATAVTGNGKGNVVGNYYKAGPNTDNPLNGPREILYWERRGGHAIYMNGNVGPNCPDGCEDEWEKMAGSYDGKHSCFQSGGQCLDSKSDTRHAAPQVNTTSAFEAYEQVLANAGATLPQRDDVDKRIIKDIKDGTGQLINDPPTGDSMLNYAESQLADNDHDGMLDAWEMSHFNTLDRGSATDSSSDCDGDGYTDLEEFLNDTDPQSNGILCQTGGVVEDQYLEFLPIILN